MFFRPASSLTFWTWPEASKPGDEEEWSNERKVPSKLVSRSGTLTSKQPKHALAKSVRELLMPRSLES
jgi:hypothetical protein